MYELIYAVRAVHLWEKIFVKCDYCSKSGQTNLIFCMMLSVGVVLCMPDQYRLFLPLAAIITARHRGMLATRRCRRSIEISAHLSTRPWWSSPRFWAGILPLAVEVGRYRSLPLSERVCTMCQLQLVEDEYHILCVCGSYDEFRTTLYNKASTTFNEFHNIPELDKFVYLINNLQRDVIAFLVKALTKRRNYMYVWTHLPLPCSFVLLCVTNRDI